MDYRPNLWSVHPDVRPMIANFMRRQAADPIPEEVRAALERADEAREVDVTRGVALIPLRGIITPRSSLLSLIFGGGGGGLESFRATFRQALASEDVSAILLDVDSPGGRTDLVTETAREIRAARGTKPIIAISNTMAASAAYYIASQADELVVTPSGDVGSIGVFVMHDDISEADKKAGITTTFIEAPEDGHKTEGNPFEPLSEDAREAIQEMVNDYYELFVGDVAEGRGVSVETVRSEQFGRGRMLTAEKAVQAGMADRVASIEEVLSGMAAGPESRENVDEPAETRTLPSPDGVDEVRSADLEADVSEADGVITLAGYAAVFDSRSEDLGGFTEQIKRGAFRKVLRTKPDVRFLLNHTGLPLARTESGTLRLSEDVKGLRFEADLPDTERARELVEAVKRSDLDQMSFRFRLSTEGREWTFPEEGLPERTITEIDRLLDVSAVTFAAYTDTEVGVRSAVCGMPLVDEAGKISSNLVGEAWQHIHSGEVHASPADRRELERASAVALESLASSLGSPEEQHVDEPTDAATEGESYGLAARSRRLRLLELDQA